MGAVLALSALSAPAMASPPTELAPRAHSDVHADGRVVYHYDRPTQAARAARPQSGSPNMTNHGGVVMPTASTLPIFWGTSWGTNPGDKITGIDSFYGGYSGSGYANTTTEFAGTVGINGIKVPPTTTVPSTTTGLPHLLDGSPAAGGANSSVILQEVAAALTNNGVAPPKDGSGYYPVYTDIPRGNAGYCAYHSSGTINSTRVQFAFFWKLDGDSGCDPKDTTTGNSEGLAALANVSGHELAEAMTDPATPGAWYDGSGNENGDKCAWTFGALPVTFSGGRSWKIQGEWSNNAYTGQTGYPNLSGQKGCLAGSAIS
jgi:hypothetical protein